jgi:chromate transporter
MLNRSGMRYQQLTARIRRAGALRTQSLPSLANVEMSMNDTVIPGRTQLFLGFAKIGLLGFGGVAPWARHIIVAERRWLSERDYASTLGIGQILPGPNTVNSAVIIGDRFHGTTGAMLAVSGLLCTPIAVLIGIALLYDRLAGFPSVGAAIGAGAAAAAGLVIGTAIKMARRLKPDVAAVAVGVAAFAAVGLFHLPMALAIVVLAPISIAIVWWQRRAK